MIRPLPPLRLFFVSLVKYTQPVPSLQASSPWGLRLRYRLALPTCSSRAELPLVVGQ